jgi:hypothetical protein
MFTLAKCAHARHVDRSNCAALERDGDWITGLLGQSTAVKRRAAAADITTATATAAAIVTVTLAAALPAAAASAS